MPRGEDQLKWTVTEKIVGHRNMNTIFASESVKSGGHATALPKEKTLSVAYRFNGEQRSLDDFFARTNATALLVIKNGRIVLERYERGYTDRSAGSSRSMAKTFSGALIGVALREGKIRSLDDKVLEYVPELGGTMYGNVPLRNLITMTSGVPYRENPNDPTSDLYPLQACTTKNEKGCFLRFARELGSRKVTPALPGEVFNYSSADSVVEALVLERAIGMSPAQYLSEKIWIPFGMERDGYWNVEAPGGAVVGPSGVGAVLRDYGRFGLYLMREGVLPNGIATLPSDWMTQAIQPTVASVKARRPYGFNIWLPDGAMPGSARAFFGLGSSGQVLMVDPVEQLVIVKWAAWDNGPVQRAMRDEDWALFKAIAEQLHARR